MRTVVITYKYIFYLIQETQRESGSTFLNYLTVTREEIKTPFVTWAPAFEISPMVIACLPTTLKKTRGKITRKEMHPHLLCLLSEGGRQANGPSFFRGPW